MVVALVVGGLFLVWRDYVSTDFLEIETTSLATDGLTFCGIELDEDLRCWRGRFFAETHYIPGSTAAFAEPAQLVVVGDRPAAICARDASGLVSCDRAEGAPFEIITGGAEEVGVYGQVLCARLAGESGVRCTTDPGSETVISAELGIISDLNVEDDRVCGNDGQSVVCRSYALAGDSIDFSDSVFEETSPVGRTVGYARTSVDVCSPGDARLGSGDCIPSDWGVTSGEVQETVLLEVSNSESYLCLLIDADVLCGEVGSFPDLAPPEIVELDDVETIAGRSGTICASQRDARVSCFWPQRSAEGLRFEVTTPLRSDPTLLATFADESPRGLLASGAFLVVLVVGLYVNRPRRDYGADIRHLSTQIGLSDG